MRLHEGEGMTPTEIEDLITDMIKVSGQSREVVITMLVQSLGPQIAQYLEKEKG